jgi:hypothetical protein
MMNDMYIKWWEWVVLAFLPAYKTTEICKDDYNYEVVVKRWRGKTYVVSSRIY